MTIQLGYAPDLVEEAVLLAERTMAAVDVRAFRSERDAIYLIAAAQIREPAFQSVHWTWFIRLGLNRVLEQVIDERTSISRRLLRGLVRRAHTGRDEGGDLIDRVVSNGLLVPTPDTPTLLLRLRPRTLLDPVSLRTLLHHELTHVEDMLDPAFGYERALPASDDGPSADVILADRYRIVWDSSIDGRLVRSGLAAQGARDARWNEFSTVFAMLGDKCSAVFERWFCGERPTHAAIVAFITMPSPDTQGAKRCPICRFPVASLDPRAAHLSKAVVDAIRVEHPQWTIEHGLCLQCLDLYEARHAHADYAYR